MAAARPAPVPRLAPKLDEFGKPLPIGATLRIGGVRWKPTYDLGDIQFCLGSSCIVVAGHGTEVWDCATGARVRTLACTATILRLSFDGRYMLAGEDGAVEVWDLKTGVRIQQFRGIKSYYWMMAALSPDGKHVALCKRTSAEMREVATGRLVRTFPGHRDNAALPLFSPDGRWLAVGECRTDELDSSVRMRAATETDPPYRAHIYDLRTGKRAHQFPTNPARAWPYQFSTTGEQLLTYPRGAYDLRTGKVVEAKGLDEIAYGDRLSSDLQFFVRCHSSDFRLKEATKEEIELWRLQFIDVMTGKRIHRWTEKVAWPHWSHRLALSPDGKTLAMHGWCGQPGLFLWDVKTGRRLNYPEREGLGALASSLSPDGNTLATINAAGLVRLWDLDTGRPARDLEAPPMTAVRIAFSPDGKVLAHAGGEKDGAVIRLLDVTSGKVKSTSPPTGVDPAGICWARGGRAMAVWGEDHAPRVWDLETNKLGPALPKTEPGPAWAAFSPDGKGILRVGIAPTGRPRMVAPLRLSDCRTGKPLVVPPLARGRAAFTFADYTPDGTRLIVAGGGRLRTHDAASGRLLHDCRFSAHLDQVLAISPDGRFVAGRGHRSPTWTLYEVMTGEPVRSLSHPSGAVERVYFHPDGRRAVSVCSDSTALVWDLSWPEDMPRLRPGPVDTPEWKLSWEELGSDHTSVADRRAWAMACQPAEAVRYLADRLRPAPRRDKGRIARLIRDLDADDFATREAASKALAALGPLVEPELRTAIGEESSAEVRREVGRLLAVITSPALTAEGAAMRRGVMVLERAGSPDAIILLTRLAAGEPLADLSREAAQSLVRLNRNKLSR